MIIKRREHSVPGLSMTSTADISFMLLIFFLVTSSMNPDKGIRSKLPPVDNAQNKEAALVMKDRILVIRILPGNVITVNDSPTPVDKLRKEASSFIRLRGADHLLRIDASPDADYETYFNVQNELVAAYNDVRNSLAQKKYGKSLLECTASQRQTITEQCPQRVSEVYDLRKGGEQ